MDNARLYRASEDARAAAEKANRAKDEFLATLSHELRTPLTPILGWTVMLRSGTLDPTAMHRGLEVIERNVRAQTQLIGDLLDVSRIITGSCASVNPSRSSPASEAGWKCAAVRGGEGRSLGIDLSSRAANHPRGPGPSPAGGVEPRLQRGGVHAQGGRIEVRVVREEAAAGRPARYLASVTDDGAGIAPQHLPRLTERFYRVNVIASREKGGTGLGLAIVKHILNRHRGELMVTSTVGQGSTFTVRLPLTAPLPGPAPPKAEPADPDVRLDGVRVMVVEDEEDVRDFLRVSLVHYGAEVTAFATSADALAAMEGQRPDVLVSDIGMPGEDGYAFIRRVRALGPDRGGQVPAAALTAYAKGEDGQRVLSPGSRSICPNRCNLRPGQRGRHLAGRSVGGALRFLCQCVA